jgi:hypothetical protein
VHHGRGCRWPRPSPALLCIGRRLRGAAGALRSIALRRFWAGLARVEGRGGVDVLLLLSQNRLLYLGRHLGVVDGYRGLGGEGVSLLGRCNDAQTVLDPTFYPLALRSLRVHEWKYHRTTPILWHSIVLAQTLVHSSPSLHSQGPTCPHLTSRVWPWYSVSHVVLSTITSTAGGSCDPYQPPKY